MLIRALTCTAASTAASLRRRTSDTLSLIAVQVQPLSVCSRRFCSAGRPASRQKKSSPITWKSVGITFGVGSMLMGWMLYVKREKELKYEKERKRAIGKAKIGGHFELVDVNGVTRRSEDFRGKWMLVYFGFTHCPDICPDELEKMAKVIDLIDTNHPEIQLQPLFITVDPERDDAKSIKSYLSEFHERILGLTGTVDQLAKTTKSFRVYFSAGPRDQEDDYIVDHTVIMYLIAPNGDFVDYYGQTRTAKQIVEGILFQKAKLDASNSKLFGIF